MSEALLEQVYTELKSLKKDVHFIKEHMIDVDTIMTPEEENRFNESLNDLKERSVQTESFAFPKSYYGLDFKWTPVY